MIWAIFVWRQKSEGPDSLEAHKRRLCLLERKALFPFSKTVKKRKS